MIFYPYLLLSVGLLLLFLEFYLPGSLMAILGGISIVSGLLLLLYEGGSGLAMLVYLFVMGIGVFITIRLALFFIKRGRGTMYLNTDQEGFIAGKYDPKLIGREAVAHTGLRPGGFVLIDEQKYAAVSVTGYIAEGEIVEVFEIEGETLKVRKKCLS